MFKLLRYIYILIAALGVAFNGMKPVETMSYSGCPKGYDLSLIHI